MPNSKERAPSSPPAAAAPREPSAHRWTFLSNHGHVLVCLARDPHARLRDIAERIGITERAVGGLVHDLEAEGFLERHRAGRRNSYVLRLDRPLRHAIEGHRDVRDLIELFLDR